MAILLNLVKKSKSFCIDLKGVKFAGSTWVYVVKNKHKTVTLTNW